MLSAPLVLILAALAPRPVDDPVDDPVEHDVVVYGGTSAAVAAAVQVRRMGHSVVVVSPDVHLGGLSSSGLGWTDSGEKRVVGGIAREFYHRVWLHYEDDEAWVWQEREQYGGRGQGAPAVDGEARTMWIFEPHVAQGIFEDLVREYDLEVHRDEWLDRDSGVVLEQGRITSIRTLSGSTYRGRVFLDCTYEGDLMAAAGVTTFVGRESNDTYGESLNGVQRANARSHQFQPGIDPYVVPGDPSSGLLPRIQEHVPGPEGSGDRGVQAYNFRVCLTQVPENRVPFSEPAGYDAGQYELLLRTLLAGSHHYRGKFDPIPNAKTDTNNHGSFSTDCIGANHDYPEASYARRREIVDEHERYQKGYFWFLASDPRVPEDVRAWVSAWGLARDEFVDNGHWPHQIYVREARRMVSDFVLTEHHVRGTRPTPRPVGMGSYNMDSHHVWRYVGEDGFVHNEGDVQVAPGGPYAIDMGALVPARGECPNLVVPVCLSASHIAFGSVRMEPVFLVLGQSAATLAVLAVEGQHDVQDVPYPLLRERLLADGQVLEDPRRPDLDAGPGTLVDDDAARGSEGWTHSSSTRPFVGRGYLHDGDTAKGERELIFSTELEPGLYSVEIAYPAHPNRASNAPVTVLHAGGETRVHVDQRHPAPGGFLVLGRFAIGARAQVRVGNAGTDGHVVADAVRWVPVDGR